MRAEILGPLDEGHRAFIYTNRDAARRGAPHLRQHVRDHLRARNYRHRRRDARRRGTLLTLVLERRRELSLLRLIGAARRRSSAWL